MTNLSFLFTNKSLVNVFEEDIENIKKIILELKINYDKYFTASISEFYEDMYKKLTKSYQNEYVFKNAIANKILIGRHSLNTSSIYTELRIGIAKADIAIFNGTSYVYEIKTQYDSLDRLEKQLENYKKFFEYINIVTVESKVNSLEALLDDFVGIIVLTPKYTLKTIRKAKSNIQNIDQYVLFDILKKDEYLKVIKHQYGYIPDLPNTQIFSKCKEMFMRLDKTIAHKEVLKILKKRKSHIALKENIKKFPSALRLEILNNNFDTTKQEKILDFLNRPINELFTRKESNVLSIS